MWTERPFISLDFKSTGAETVIDRAVSVALAFFHPAIGEPIVRDWVIDPGIAIPPESTQIHGMDTAYVRTHGERPRKVFKELHELLVLHWHRDMPLVAFDAPFVLTLADYEIDRHLPGTGLVVPGPVIDPLTIDRHLFPDRPESRTLAALCELYRVPVKRSHHARADALNAGALARAQIPIHPELARRALSWLHTQQKVWHREYCERAADVLEQRVTVPPGDSTSMMLKAQRWRDRASAWPRQARIGSPNPVERTPSTSS